MVGTDAFGDSFVTHAIHHGTFSQHGPTVPSQVAYSHVAMASTHRPARGVPGFHSLHDSINKDIVLMDRAEVTHRCHTMYPVSKETSGFH